jgi:uncharacterized protein (TIGR00730 family)
MENKVKKEIKDKNRFRVTLFGSSRIKEDDPIYSKIEKLGEILAQEEVDIVTGGGPGLMKAANEGHEKGRKSDNVRSIGIGIKLPWEQGFNKYVEDKEEYDSFSERLDEFMVLSNAVIVAPGGIGTLLELFYTWQLVQVHHICNIPIILFGKQWKGLLKWIKKNPLKTKYLSEDEFGMVYYAKTEEEVMEIIREVHKAWKEGGENFCLNYKKYKIK